MVPKKVTANQKSEPKTGPILTSDDIADFKKRYDPDLVDALLTRIEDFDFEAAFNVALNNLLDQSPGGAAFDNVALSRRKHEASLIEQEKRMFEQMANLMTHITTRYAELTGIPVAEVKKGGAK